MDKFWNEIWKRIGLPNRSDQRLGRRTKAALWFCLGGYVLIAAATLFAFVPLYLGRLAILAGVVVGAGMRVLAHDQPSQPWKNVDLVGKTIAYLSALLFVLLWLTQGL